MSQRGIRLTIKTVYQRLNAITIYITESNGTKGENSVKDDIESTNHEQENEQDNKTMNNTMNKTMNKTMNRHTCNIYRISGQSQRADKGQANREMPN